MSKRIMIMAGGTGGHVFPGLAVADELSSRGWQVAWLGTEDKMEARVVPAAGYPIHYLSVRGVRRNGWKVMLAAPFQLCKAIWHAWRVMGEFGPDVVLGMGGFASGPGGVAAWLRRTPLVIHEQNSVAGMTNRLLHRLSTLSLAAFDQALAGAKTVGNPLRKAFAQKSSHAIQTPVNVLIVGGSLGARALNQSVPTLLANCADIEVWHQCGAGNQQQVEQHYEAAGRQGEVTVAEFIDDMAAAYQWADVVICRAGALTVSEIAAVGVAAVFVPLPHAVDDHQTRNAQALADVGAARIVPQSELDNIEQHAQLHALLKDVEVLQSMGRNAHRVAKPKATQDVADFCAQLVEKDV